MDTEPEELQFLGFFGILGESLKVLRSHAKLFVALSLSLILPLCFVGLGHNLVTEPILSRINWDMYILSREHGSAETKTEEDISKEMTLLYIVLAVYLLFLLAFSLLSTSAIVYSVACIYSERVTSYRKVMTVVPRVWKRLIVTFFWALLLVAAYTVFFFVSLFLVATIFGTLFDGNAILLNVILWAGAVLFMASLLYLNCVWHLGSVITVLEESYGLEAMRKSLQLIKGKQCVAFLLFLLYSVCTFLISLGFGFAVLHGHHLQVPKPVRFVVGCGLILLLSSVDLLGFLVQTVFYFACKAYHHESIDRLELSLHLGAYLGEYAPLRGSIQMEDFGP